MSASAPTPAPRAGRELVRQRVVVVLTVVVGTAALAWLLRLEPGDDRFVPGAAGVAVLWALGALAAGRAPLRGRLGASRAAATGAAVGAVAALVCLVAGWVASAVPVLREPAQEVLAHAATDSVVVVALALLNGVAEELFFRGALYDVLPARLAVPATTVLYALTTLGSGVLLLTLAAVLLGLLTAVLRRVTGGVLAPAAAHLTWTASMIGLLPSVLST